VTQHGGGQKKEGDTGGPLFAKVHPEIDKLDLRFLKGGLGREELYHRGLKVLECYRLEKYFCPKVEKESLLIITTIQQRIKEILHATDVPLPEKVIENQLLG
jgi:hypothetical protein